MVAWFPVTALPSPPIQKCWPLCCCQRWGLGLEPAVRPQWAHPSGGDWGGRYLRMESLGRPRPQRQPSTSAGPWACWGPEGQFCNCHISLPTSTSPTAHSPLTYLTFGSRTVGLQIRFLEQPGGVGGAAMLTGLLLLTSVTITSLPSITGTWEL